MNILRNDDPFLIFQNWFEEEQKKDPKDYNAMALATATPDGKPSVRMVLLKGHGPDGFHFYTNSQSRKGLELQANPQASLCLYFHCSERQVRLEGRVEELPAPVIDAYFKSRHYLSRLGAWASAQSQQLVSREALEKRVAEAEEKYGRKDIPRPPHWKGYRLVPDSIEFWQAGQGRLHDRFIFTRIDGSWDLVRLNP